MHDLVLRGGTPVDGTGAAVRNGDANGRRTVQRTSGCRMTIQSGQVFSEDAGPTRARCRVRQRRR